MTPRQLAARMREAYPGAAGVALDAAAALDAQEDEINRLRAALEWIERAHVPDQPSTAGGDELSWAYQWVGVLRHKAKRALRGTSHAD